VLLAAERTASLAPWTLSNLGPLAAFRALTGDEVGAAAALRKLGDGKAYLAPLGFTYYFLIGGEIDQAADWAAKAIEQRTPGMVNFLRSQHAAPLRRSPRWPELAKMINLSEAR
jgi:hypothetical protein